MHKEWIDKSDLIVVSSYAAREDLLTQYPNASEKVKVVHFVSQPDKTIIENENLELEKKFSGKFFYLPNQFWSHKNHLVVFKAIKLLKNKGIEVKLLTTGAQNDYRDGGKHFEMLESYVRNNNLQENIKFLGLIPYSEVFFLMKKSLAMINPSLFEGWSSTVEESKSLGKTMILSDIPVHREQSPLKGIYFEPDREDLLSEILESVWEGRYTFDLTAKPVIEQSLGERTKEFSDCFYNVVMSLFNGKNTSKN
jgi:glycosyltransferase involved in cell wall biosynthesis